MFINKHIKKIFYYKEMKEKGYKTCNLMKSLVSNWTTLLNFLHKIIKYKQRYKMWIISSKLDFDFKNLQVIIMFEI